MNTESIRVDLLVVGAGLAGLRAARQGVLGGLNTAIAWTGPGASPHVLAYNALAEDCGDSFEAYHTDMLRAGGGLNHPELVTRVVNESKNLNQSLAESGFIPDQNAQGNYLRRHLGGCSYPRSFYVGDSTGIDIVRILWQELREHGVLELKDTQVLIPVLHQGQVVGAVGVNQSGEMIIIQAGAVVLACGGIGSLVDGSTYPKETKAGYAAFALLAGAELVDMEFLQFEPLVCFTHPVIDRMEIPTAMLGDGAVLRNREGKRFLLKRGYACEAGVEKAALALHIEQEIRQGFGSPRGGVYVDATGVPLSVLKQYHIRTQRLAKACINLSKDFVEVRPTSHSHMGGIRIDSNCASRVPGLYAGGEAAGGLHGASRIAGNSGTDALVTGDIAGRSAVQYVQNLHRLSSAQWERSLHDSLSHAAGITSCIYSEKKDIEVQIGKLLRENCGIIRSSKSLTEAQAVLETFKRVGTSAFQSGWQIHEILSAWSAYSIAHCMFDAALLRQESRGAHVRSDFPKADMDWEKSIFCSIGESGQLNYRYKRNSDK